MFCGFAVWKNNTPGCQLTNADSTVQLIAADTTTTTTTRGSAVVCMSAGALVQCGHTISFHLRHTDAAPAAAGRQLMLSECDGVGLSVSDNVNVDSDNVIFYSFHGKPLQPEHGPEVPEIL